jgi:4-hydroxybenzoate polyprenyltransferase/phosphoserine phosphatase
MTTPAHEPPARPDRSRPRPVFVDLDGTLIRSDLLWEGIRLMVRERPFELAIRAPFWLLRGKAHFKSRMAASVLPDVRGLPYRPVVLAYIAEARRTGATITLASASPRRWVEAVAAHVGSFDRVIASTDDSNLSGAAKLAAIQQQVGATAFEYLGNSAVDVPIWHAAAVATSVDPDRRARKALADVSHHVGLPVESRRTGAAILRQLRPHQWAKNLLLFVPLLLAHEVANPGKLLSVLVAFASFCAVASAGYVLNDLIDVDADRAHPTKCRRPIASGSLPIAAAIGLFAGLLVVAGTASAFWLSSATAGMVLLYLVLTLAYSFYFKERLLLDVLLLAGLYTHRVLTGGIAAEVAVSPWLLAFSTFFFLSLALVKRYVEISGRAGDAADEQIAGRAYRVGDSVLVLSMGLSCAYIAVLVLCLFVSSEDVSRLYDRPDLLWLMCPLMFYWISRIWFLAHRGELHDDPVMFATTDRASYVAGILLALIVVAAT